MQWARAVMVPACREFELLPGCLESLANIPHQTIVVVVLNERADAAPQVRQDNQQTHSWLLSHKHEKINENESNQGKSTKIKEAIKTALREAFNRKSK